MGSYLDFTSDDIVIILLMFDALLICVLSHFVVLMIVKTAKKNMNTEETPTRKREKNSICKHETGFLNFLRDLTSTILATFQIFVMNFLSTLRP